MMAVVPCHMQMFHLDQLCQTTRLVPRLAQLLRGDARVSRHRDCKTALRILPEAQVVRRRLAPGVNHVQRAVQRRPSAGQNKDVGAIEAHGAAVDVERGEHAGVVVVRWEVLVSERQAAHAAEVLLAHWSGDW